LGEIGGYSPDIMQNLIMIVPAYAARLSHVNRMELLVA
jgi:hypothetical protein